MEIEWHDPAEDWNKWRSPAISITTVAGCSIVLGIDGLADKLSAIQMVSAVCCYVTPGVINGKYFLYLEKELQEFSLLQQVSLLELLI
jgi:hypothetical protein